MNAGLNAKKAIRRGVRDRLDASTPDDRATWSHAISERLDAWLATRPVGGVMLYWPTPHEPDLRATLTHAHHAGWRVALPRMDWTHSTMEAWVVQPDTPLEVREHGISEPVAGEHILSGDLGILVIPGMAFDEDGRRLGRGGGFYDRYLGRICDVERRGRVTHGPLLVGVCFEIQVWKDLPTEDHDVGMDLVITERRSIAARPDRLS